MSNTLAVVHGRSDTAYRSEEGNYSEELSRECSDGMRCTGDSGAHIERATACATAWGPTNVWEIVGYCASPSVLLSDASRWRQAAEVNYAHLHKSDVLHQAAPSLSWAQGRVT